MLGLSCLNYYTIDKNRQKMQHHFWFVLCTIVEDVTSFLNHALGDYAIVKVIASLLNYALVYYTQDKGVTLLLIYTMHDC